MSDPSKSPLTNESVWSAICYAYKVDPYSPTFLSKGDEIFKIDGTNNISISSNKTIDMKLQIQYSDTDFTAAHWAAVNMKVEGQFKAFSGAASMAVETTEESKYHTVRVDAIGVCTKNCITTKGPFRTHPENFLTEDFRTAVNELTVEEIESRIGVFYPIKLQLGGMVKRSYIMEATEEDNESKITAELQASFGRECLGASNSNTLKSGNRSTNKNAKVRHEWKAEGGDVDLWFKVWLSDADQSELSSAMKVAKEWADTIDASNYYPFDFELRPLWELIEKVDADKAKKFRLYLEEKWEKDANRHLPTMFLPAKLRVIQLSDASKRFIANACNSHKEVLVEESAKAQNHLDHLLHFVDKRGYKRWRKAAESGKKEVIQIRELVFNDPDITVEDLIEQLEVRSDYRFVESKRYLGIWVNDSKESNRVEKLNKDILDEIIKRLQTDLTSRFSVEEWHVQLDECEKHVNKSVQWFDENLSDVESRGRKADVSRAIEQVQIIQKSLSGLLKRLETEFENHD